MIPRSYWVELTLAVAASASLVLRIWRLDVAADRRRRG